MYYRTTLMITNINAQTWMIISDGGCQVLRHLPCRVCHTQLLKCDIFSLTCNPGYGYTGLTSSSCSLVTGTSAEEWNVLLQ